MRLSVNLFLLSMVFLGNTQAAVCDATYYLQKAELITLTGSDISKLETASVDTISSYNQIPIIDTLNIEYKFPSTFTSSCDEFKEQSVQYLFRGKKDTEFTKNEENRWVRFYPKVALGTSGEAPWFIFKEGSPDGNASEYFAYTALDDDQRNITGFYAGGVRQDTIKDQFGTISSFRISSIPWDPYIDTARALTHMREQFNDPADENTMRHYTIQLLKIFFDTNMVDPLSPTPQQQKLSGTFLEYFDNGIQFHIPASFSQQEILTISNVQGKHITSLLPTSSGHYFWKGLNRNRATAPSGIYFYQVRNIRGKVYLLPKQ